MPTLLIADDNPDNRDALSRRLQRHGFEVVTVADGLAAVTAARTSTPALILMDLSMPVLDGWQATARLKAAPLTASLPIIALSSHALLGDQEPERALVAGCAGYHTKPLDFDALVAQIHRLLTVPLAKAG